MARLLQDAAVPKDAILLEDQSTNTRQNLRFAQRLLAPLGETNILIVSDAYHLPRACLIAKRLGFQASGSAPPLNGARAGPQIKGWLREIPALAAVLVGLR